MLVIISDLHFVDGTAGEHNVPKEAFEIFFEDLSWAADRLKKDGRDIQEIKIVFLGDIFDILRTEAWFDFDIDERPWGSNDQKIEEHSKEIFESIVNKNKDTFDLLSKKLTAAFDFTVEPERIYVPGNHDRLCNKYKTLRSKVKKALGLKTNVSQPFGHYYQNTDYGVFARHGHEYDKFNYEGATSFTYEDYMRVPIGDPITTELIAKLPKRVMEHPDVQDLSQEQQKAFRRNLEDIENVRPFSATLEWLFYQVKKNLNLKEAIEDSVDGIIEEFNELDYVKQWYKHHDKWLEFMDEADKIQSALFMLEKFKVFSSEKWMPLLEKVKNRFMKDDLLEAAPSEYTHLDSRIRYVVYGHTHDPLQVPIRSIVTPEGSVKQHVYINSGTWRTRYHMCREGSGFIGWKNLTYTVFYKKDERGTDFPAYETWTGTLKTI